MTKYLTAFLILAASWARGADIVVGNLSHKVTWDVAGGNNVTAWFTPPPDSYTKLLLHCDGTNTSPTFIDEIGKTVTRAGNAFISTAQMKFGTASGRFGGGYIWSADSDDWFLGTNNFTIDFWTQFVSLPTDGNRANYFIQYQSAANAALFDFARDGAVYKWRLYYIDPAGNTLVDGPDTVTTGVWYHVAGIRSENKFKIFRDGVQKGLTVTNSSSWINLAATNVIGSRMEAVDYKLDGYIDEFRISKGVARWTNNFTPPTHPY